MYVINVIMVKLLSKLVNKIKNLLHKFRKEPPTVNYARIRLESGGDDDFGWDPWP